MPFDAAEVARQIEQSRSAVRAAAAARVDAVAFARRIYLGVEETAWEQRVQDNAVRRWVAVPHTRLREHPYYEAGRADYCVVATDSSFVAPDKHRGALSHLVNVGRVMIRYGDSRAAELDNVPRHYTDLLVEGEEVMSSRVLAAKCALRELEELYEWARRYGASMALLDGSLMQLPIVLSKDPQVREIMASYFDVLAAFREIGVPVVGYISRPDSQMVMRAIRMLGCERETPCESRPAEPCSCQPLWSLVDTDLFWDLLEPGERSPIFEPLFSYMDVPAMQPLREMVFTYLGTDYELVRLEFPLWLHTEGVLDRTIARILHQVRLGKGYPNSIDLAHQYAVLHNSDRESYYFLLERAGLLRPLTEKARSKRAAGQSI